MLNEAQRNSLRILMSLIEEKMRAMEFRLVHPHEQALMFEIRNDLSHDMPQRLREKVAEVSCLIQMLRDRLALPREIRSARRELVTGLSQLWVLLQDSDSKGLQRFGDVAPAVSPALDVHIKRLAHVMLEMEDIVTDHRLPVFAEGEGKQSDSHP